MGCWVDEVGTGESVKLLLLLLLLPLLRCTAGRGALAVRRERVYGFCGCDRSVAGAKWSPVELADSIDIKVPKSQSHLVTLEPRAQSVLAGSKVGRVEGWWAGGREGGALTNLPADWLHIPPSPPRGFFLHSFPLAAMATHHLRTNFQRCHWLEIVMSRTASTDREPETRASRHT